MQLTFISHPLFTGAKELPELTSISLKTLSLRRLPLISLAKLKSLYLVLTFDCLRL